MGRVTRSKRVESDHAPSPRLTAQEAAAERDKSITRMADALTRLFDLSARLLERELEVDRA